MAIERLLMVILHFSTLLCRNGELYSIKNDKTNTISIVYDYLSSIKSTFPPIFTGSEKHKFVDVDTLYIQFIKNGYFDDKEFNIIYANLKNNKKLFTHFFLNDNESYKENDFVKLRFPEDHLERRL